MVFGGVIGETGWGVTGVTGGLVTITEVEVRYGKTSPPTELANLVGGSCGLKAITDFPFFIATNLIVTSNAFDTDGA